MDIDNRITGPGYYPKRPTGRILGKAFVITKPNGQDYLYRVALRSAEINTNSICWRGDGRYTYTQYQDAREFTPTGWCVYTNDGEIAFEVQVPTFPAKVGDTYFIDLRCAGAPPYTREAISRTGWKFEALQPGMSL